MSTELRDIVVLGGGSGGYATALRAAQLGQSVLLVEEDRVGGTCLHRGCVPTKALLHVGEIADGAREGEALGVSCGTVAVDLGQARAFAEKIVGRLHGGLSGLLSGRGVTTVSGEGRLDVSGEHPVVRVGDQEFAGRSVVCATGATPKSLPGIEVDGERVLTSDQALKLTTLPATALVIGGGVIGVEFASLWRSMGAKVAVIEAQSQLLPSDDADVAAALRRDLHKRGVDIHLDARIRSVTPHEQGVRVELESNRAFEVDVVLVAVGRAPRSAELSVAGVALSTSGHVEVDSRLVTSDPRVRAVGDLVAGPQLAHRGFAHGIFVAEDIAVDAGADLPLPQLPADELIPKITYTDPQVLSVGLTRAQAAEQFGDEAVQSVRYDLGGNARSLILGSRGFVQLVRRVDGPIVGLQAIGRGVAELAGEAQLIAEWEAYPQEVAAAIHAHPTIDEAIGEAALALAGKPLHLHS